MHREDIAGFDTFIISSERTERAADDRNIVIRSFFLNWPKPFNLLTPRVIAKEEASASG